MAATFLRASGVAAIIGGIVLVPAGTLAWLDAWHAEFGEAKRVVDVALVAAFLLLLTGFVGLHLRQRAHYGRLGRLGFLLALAGVPAILLYFLGLLMIPVGLVLFGLGTYRAGLLNRKAALLFTASVPAALFAWVVLGLAEAGEYATLVFLALHGPAWAWLGWSLFSERSAAT